MEYVKVESSQIDSVGFGEGHYGPETLGIRFKNKSGITEYHYGGVSQEQHRAFMDAEHVGSYFAKSIKPFPDQYPFTKVEALDPQLPFSKRTETSTMEGVTTTRNGHLSDSTSSMKTTDGDAPSPGSALAEIDTLKPEFIFLPGNIDSILVKVREEVLEMAKGLDPSTPEKQKRIREIKGLVVSRRTFIEKVRVGYVADLVLKKGMTDTISKNVQARLSGIEDEILKVTGYAAWEQGVKDRKAKNEKIVFDINAMQPHVYSTIDSLILAIAQLNAIDTDSMEELSTLAAGSKKQRLEMLTADLVRRQEVEAQRLELERLRAESAARAEAGRLAEVKRQEDARIEAAVEAAKVATRQEVIAELTLPSAADLDAVAEEQKITEATAEPAPVVAPTPVFKSPEETREQMFNREAVAGLMSNCFVDRQKAIQVLIAITKGLIPHVSMVY